VFPSVVTAVVSVQLLPPYGILHNGFCNLPGCAELNDGVIPWLSVAVTLTGPWIIVSSLCDWKFVFISCIAMIATYIGLTVKWLDSPGERAAVILFLCGNAILATVSSHVSFLPYFDD
jgi:hypothetical protein